MQNNDIVLYRYADVLLMKAEAKVRNGEDGSAELNAVRTRVGMPARKTTLATILDERLLELMWEGWRHRTSSGSVNSPRFTTNGHNWMEREAATPPCSLSHRPPST